MTPTRYPVVVVAVCVAALFSPVARAALGDATTLMAKTVRGTDASIVGGSIVTQTAKGGLIWPQTGVSGFGGKDKTIPLSLDSCVNLNTMSELLVAYATVKLQSDTKFVDSLDAQLQGDFAPGGLAFVNPSNNAPISYKHLLTHTSTITDSLFLSRLANTPATVGSLTNFVENYFVSAGPRLNAAVFNSNVQPGTATAYARARANTALLAYALERALRSQPKYTGLQDYIAQEILTPFGMSSTFFLQPDGTAPGLTPTPSFTDDRFTSIATASSSVYTTFFAGCIADQFGTTVPIHPAWPADFMGYTTPSDIARLVFNLFIDKQNSAVAALSQTMQERRSVSTGAIQGQVGQGLGIQFFNGDALCASATATKVISSCPVTNSSVVFGYATARLGSAIGFFCTDSATATFTSADVGLVCTTVSNVHSGAASVTFDGMFAEAAASFQEQFGTTIVLTPAPTPPFRTILQDELYGVYVFIGTFVTLLFIFFGTMLLQYMLLPAAIPPVTSAGAAAVDKDGRPVAIEKSPKQQD